MEKKKRKKRFYMDDVELGKIPLITSDMTQKEIDEVENEIKKRIQELNKIMRI